MSHQRSTKRGSRSTVAVPNEILNQALLPAAGNAIVTIFPDDPSAEKMNMQATAISYGPASSGVHPLMDLAVVLPTFNERANIDEIIARLYAVLAPFQFEIVFVDDDSADGTATVIEAYARSDRRIRLIHRVGRRGLASACMEGILSTSAPFVAVMDADLQHDESILPGMVERIRCDQLDVVVATRNADSGSMGDFASSRILLSHAGRRIASLISRAELSDPMSGFFIVRRTFFLSAVRQMYGGGFKILLDLLASSPQPAHVAEVGYTFRARQHGESKLDFNTSLEYLFLLLNKLTRGLVPARFALFCVVGCAGIVAHLLSLGLLLRVLGKPFFPAQLVATVVAMTVNFFLNNLVTFRDRRLHGRSLLLGLLSFYAACTFGAWANIVLSCDLFRRGVSWPIAGLIGVVVGSAWNYSITSLFTWQKRRNLPSVHLDGLSREWTAKGRVSS